MSQRGHSSQPAGGATSLRMRRSRYTFSDSFNLAYTDFALESDSHDQLNTQNCLSAAYTNVHHMVC